MKTRIAEKQEIFFSSLEKVWETVTNNDDYSWRSDINCIEQFDDGQRWREYYDLNKKKYTSFIITKEINKKEYCFNMENSFFTGKWTGMFYEMDDGRTKCIFREEINIKNPIIWAISYIAFDIKKIQDQYITDLKTKLGEQCNKEKQKK
jgi:hypothetical protein